MPDTNEVVIAIATDANGNNPHIPVTGEGHGSYDMVLHEAGHALDANGGGLSNSADFVAARNADLSTFTQADLDHIADKLNNRPRARHGFLTPLEVFDQLVLH